MNKRLIQKWTLWVSIPLLIIFAIYLIWGIRGFAGACRIIACISCFAAAFGPFVADTDRNGCGMFFIFAAIAAFFGLSAAQLDELEYESESKNLYEQIINHPSKWKCKEYIQRFSNTDAANKVRDIWLDLLLKDAKVFDYDSFDGSSINDRSSCTVFINLQDFISNNGRTEYGNKALLVIESICDSLYRVADKKSTEFFVKSNEKLLYFT